LTHRLRSAPLDPLILVNPGLTDHRLERSHGIAAVRKIDFDDSIRFAIVAKLDPRFMKASQFLKETETVASQEMYDVEITPVV